MYTLRKSQYRGTNFVASSTLDEEARGWAIVLKKRLKIKGKGAATRKTCVIAQTNVWADENKLERPAKKGDTLHFYYCKIWLKP